ncbi:DNA primase [Candidatus Sulfopaludibacter sp. SbA6]|nr:DNA primase [Candidatus Sulfopaludibacter sp. SbA6]
MEFAEQLKSSVDIVSVIQEYGPRLRKSGNNYSGLCPFHNEKTPSFSVSATKQFYYCFGCHAKGDVINFVMEIEKVSFYEALKTLAERHGIPMPKRSQYADEDSKLRGVVFQMHEYAQENFRANLNGSMGESARAYLARRGVSPETVDQFGLGYSDRSGRALLRILEQRNFPVAQWEPSGLVRKRDDGTFYDYFRNRLMFPIHNESGKIIGFGGRALAADDNPKYLNSPETLIYKKSAVLYNLHRAKEAIRKDDRVILVEGYMDAIGVTAAGFRAVVASCGTALTAHQVQVLKRHTQKIAVNFDPDAPGANAAERSINLLLEEGMHIHIVELDGELDPDEYCKQRGAGAYQERLDKAKGYLYWLADRARAKYDVHTSEGIVAVLKSVMPAVQRISDRLERMAIANDVASYIGVDRGMVLDSFRKAVADRQPNAIERPKEVIRADEKGLLNVLLSDVEGRERFLPELPRIEILLRLATGRIYQAIMAIQASGSPVAFESVNARLEPADQGLLAQVVFSAETEGHEPALDYGYQCLESLQRLEGQLRSTELEARVKQAERAGDLTAALRAAGEDGERKRRAYLEARIKQAERAGNQAEASRLADELRRMEKGAAS